MLNGLYLPQVDWSNPTSRFSVVVALLASLPSLFVLYGFGIVGDEFLVPILYKNDCGVFRGGLRILRTIGAHPRQFARWLLIRSLLRLLLVSLSVLCALILAIPLCLAFVLKSDVGANTLVHLTVGVVTCWLLLQVFVVSPLGAVFTSLVSLYCLQQMKAISLLPESSKNRVMIP